MSNKIVFKKVLQLGKVDYEFAGKFNNAVSIIVELRDISDDDENEQQKLELSICGNIWNKRHSDIIHGGQCIDTIAELFPTDKKVQRIKDIWKQYHLNATHAGCVHQRAFEYEPYEKHADAHCDICNYTYGTKWLYEPIPKDIIDEIMSW